MRKGMRVIVVGAAGDIGQAVCNALSLRHEIIKVGCTNGDYLVDISDFTAVSDLYRKIGNFDAVVSCAGDATFTPLDQYTQDSFMLGLRQKVMGQINLLLAGLNVISDRGSFTLMSGVLAHDPIRMGVNAATANGALAGFTKAAAIDMRAGLRVNVVSPGLLDASRERYGQWFDGHKTVLSSDVGWRMRRALRGR